MISQYPPDVFEITKEELAEFVHDMSKIGVRIIRSICLEEMNWLMFQLQMQPLTRDLDEQLKQDVLNIEYLRQYPSKMSV